MAAFNFPNSPSTNDTHTENGVTYKWNGTVWKRQNASYTDATNLYVTGIGTFAGNVSIGSSLLFGDNKKAIFGDNAGGYLEVYNSGSDSIIKSNTDDLWIYGHDNIFLAGATSNHKYLRTVDSGTVALYFNNTQRFETTNTGAKVTGDLEITGVLTYEDVKNVDSVGVITARSNVYIKNTYPRLYLQDTDTNSDFSIINSNGAFMVYDDTNSANRFTINSNGIGSFNSDLEVAGSHYITDSIIHTGDTNTKIRFPAADTFTVETAGSERLRLTSGVVASFGNSSPPAWANDTGYYNIQLGKTGFLRSDTDTSNTFMTIGQNAYKDSGGWKYAQNGGASSIFQQGGNIIFESAASGTAGNALTLTEKLRITSAGALNIGKGDEAGAVENLVELYVGGNDTSHATIRGKYNRTNEYNRSEVRFGVESNAAGKGFLAFATGTNSASERLRITSGGCVYSSNFGIGTDSNWKIRPNTSNTELAFEYATSSTLADTNIKAFFRSGGSFVLKSDPLAAGGTMGDRGLIFQANSTPTDGQVIQGITFCPHPTAIARARAGIAGVANANGGSHPQSGADLVFMTRYSADGHDLDVTTDERLRIDSSGKIKLNQTDSMIMTNADASRLRLFGGSSNSVSNGAALTLQGVSHSGGNYADLASGTGGHIQFRTGTTERLRIDSSGRLLIGAQRSYSGQGYYDDITINNSNTASGSAGGTGISLISGNNTWGAILFGDSDDDDVGAIKYSHIDNHMRFNTAGGIRFRIDADGVKFNGDTSSANALDDYEEGQWTPTIQFSSGGNTATYTSNRGGWYVKVGRLVTLNGRIEISAKGSGSSAVYFGGLPFTVGNHNSGTSGVEGGLTFSYMANVNADKGSGIIGGYASENTTQVIPFYVDTSNNFHYVEDFDLDSDASIGFTITYCV